MPRRIVIVGGVAAGASAATRARRMDEQADIVLLEKSGYVSFANCGLPYHVGGIIADRDDLLLMTPQRFEERFRIDARVRTEAVRIDREKKRVLVRDLAGGHESWLDYDKLILAPGAAPIVPPFAGVTSENVFTLRNVEDMDAIRGWVDHQNARRAVIIGAGFIGLECAEVLTGRGLQVHLVELLDQVLAPLDADMAAPVANQLRAHGVTLSLGSGLASLETQDNRATVAVLDNGTRIETDLVLLSIGVKPNSQLAADADLALGLRGGIRVDERLHTSDPDIYAAGDVAEVISAVTGETTMVPLAGPANKHGRLAGELAVTEPIARGAQAETAAHATARSAPPTARVAGTAVVGVFEQVVAMTGLTVKAAKRAGIDCAHVLIRRPHHAGYYPARKTMRLKLVYERGARRVLGMQAVGGAGVDRRADVVAAVIHFRGTVDDLAALDLAYAPQFGAAKDPVHIAAFVAQNQDDGLVRHVDADDVAGLRDDGYAFIDVRSPAEFATGHLADAVNVPLDALRARHGELPADRPLLVYCQVGQRGYLAARILAALRTGPVVNLAGGYATYAEWDASQRPATANASNT